MKTIKLITTVISGAMLSLTALASDIVTDTLGFASQGATSITELLKGKVAGVRVSSVDGNINGLVNVNIRGLNSLRGDSQPLYIVDGVILGTEINRNLNAFKDFGDAGYCAPTNPLAFLSPYDIESIEVLKNSSATSIYGAQGANGVILITTRRDKEERLSLKWNSNVSLNIPGVKSPAFRPSVAHNHYLSISGNFSKTQYYLSAQYRNANGVATGNRSNYVSVVTGIDARANDFMQFGMRAFLSTGKAFNAAGTANYGYSSLMTAARGITVFEDIDSWKTDYDDESEDSRLAATFNFDVKLAKGLVWKNTLGIDFQNYNRFFWFGQNTFFGYMNGGVVSILGTSLFRDNFKTSLQYGRYFGKHRLDLSLNGEQFYVIRKYSTMQGSTFFSEMLRNRGLSISGAFGNPSVYEFPLNRLAASATAVYDYDKIAGAKASFNASFTKKYLDGPELYPAAEAFFDLGKLCLDKNGAFSALRLDGGYGWAGNTDYTSATASASVPAEAAHYFFNLNQILSKEWHATATAGFIGDRIKIGVTYYDRTTSDKLTLLCFGKEPRAGIVGGNNLWENAEKSVAEKFCSEISNRGYELDITARIMDRESFKWNASANFAYNANRMAKVAVEDALGGLYNANVAGYPVASLYGVNEESGIASLIGNPTPKYITGISTDFRIKRLYFDVLLDGAFGHNILNMNKMLADGKFTPSSAYIEDASYFRLSRLSAGYNIPLNLKFVKSFDVKLSAGNLLTFTKYCGWNPDVNSYGNSSRNAGVDYGSYPYVRTIVLGVSVKF